MLRVSYLNRIFSHINNNDYTKNIKQYNYICNKYYSQINNTILIKLRINTVINLQSNKFNDDEKSLNFFF